MVLWSGCRLWNRSLPAKTRKLIFGHRSYPDPDVYDIDIPDPLELDEVMVVLKHIQRLDPLGSASRNLVECLAIQLEHYQSDAMLKQHAKLLLQNVELLLTNDINKLMRKTQLDMDQLKQAMTLLKSFDPAPGAKFQEQEQDYQTPDVILQKKNERWHVFLNPDVLPKLRVNSFYAGMIKRADQSADNQYLKTQMLEAKNFIKSIDELTSNKGT